MQIVSNGKTLAIVVRGKKFRLDEVAGFAVQHAPVYAGQWKGQPGQGTAVR